MLQTIVISFAGLCLLALLLSMPVVGSIQFQRMGRDDSANYTLTYLFGLVKLHGELLAVRPAVTESGPSVQLEHQGRSDEQSNNKTVTTKDIWSFFQHLTDWYDLAMNFRPLFAFTRQHLRIRTVRCQILIGTGDAASTAVLSGGLWIALGTGVGMLTHVFTFGNMPELEVTPTYQQKVFEVKADSIFSITAGHAIIAVIRFLRVWRRRNL
ncbi:DUF2953 domain-containing protein [Alicyclobacillus sp. SP_1]|uniref:DUF2953 domain-containing protein n=1 Tax=Alicyclobacillus sp. SP_1 TaxID=2942475 RepID=UPI0021573A6E|nr:DUF2953 domain-containing protein [Alicyclobacillus sp. SP_1]